MTVPVGRKSIRDNWKTSPLERGPFIGQEGEGDEYWTGQCVFYDDWAEASDPIASVANLMREVSAVIGKDKKVDLPNGLVF